ncbi:MAG: hypothetical protein MJ053_03185 [Elusimicrobiaceae bacterium]|nr:hypothetical protein [Elusimicrobiaceae bacterium]
MRKQVLLIGLLVMCGEWGWTGSTCEVRVDQHQDATTLERIDYCLGKNGVEKQQTPKLVTQSITVKKNTVTRQNDSDAWAREGNFQDRHVSISRQYIETKQFPLFENDIPSESERLAAEKARQEERQEMLAQQQVQLGDVNEIMAPHRVEQVTVSSEKTTTQTTTYKGPDATRTTVTTTTRTVSATPTATVGYDNLSNDYAEYAPAVTEKTVEEKVIVEQGVPTSEITFPQVQPVSEPNGPVIYNAAVGEEALREADALLGLN